MRARPILILLACLAAAGPAKAGPQEAQTFITELVADAMTTLKDPSLNQQMRAERLDTLLRRGFDLPRIARYVLGRSWVDASPQDRKDFTNLFETFIVRTYSARLSQYTNEVVKVTDARPEGDHGDVVESQIVHASGPPTEVEWHVDDRNGQIKILDIGVAGISMALTEREEMASVIQQNGGTVAGLNRMLAARNGNSTTADATAR